MPQPHDGNRLPIMLTESASSIFAVCETFANESRISLCVCYSIAIICIAMALVWPLFGQVTIDSYHVFGQPYGMQLVAIALQWPYVTM